jgi:endonuclease/exonuclease/phosphatase family metal-dependent hydrolase
VIALQEVERFSQRTGLQDQPARLAELLPGYHWVYGPGMDLSADVVAPDGRVTQQRRQFGNMLLCKTPILTARNHLLPKLGTLVQFSLQRCALEGVVVSAGPGRRARAAAARPGPGRRRPHGRGHRRGCV